MLEAFREWKQLHTPCGQPAEEANSLDLEITPAFHEASVGNETGIAMRQCSWPMIQAIASRILEYMFQNGVRGEGMQKLLQGLRSDAIYPKVWVKLSVSPAKYIISCNGDIVNIKNI